MIYDLIRDGFSFELVVNLLVRVFIIFCVLPIHEFAHALVSYKLGDQTARLKGRLTLSPLAHIDPFGALMIILAGFGWAKPVPVNMRNFKNRKGYMALTALAGPVSNIIMAFVFLLIMFIIGGATGSLVYIDGVLYTTGQEGIAYAAGIFMMYAATININLAVFNFIPVPPLDGSRILFAILPDKYYYKIMQYERYIAIGFMVLIALGILSTPISAVSGVIYNLLEKAASFPLKFFN
ncbi:MAG: site-2 protease family protein [Clostridia bacterium]|nr:site-2 protease family protein [Clostridia bacterium]